MKTGSFFLLIIISFSSYSQNWAPFPLDETSEWRVESNWLTGEECVIYEHYNYFVSGQQNLNGNEYYEISYTGISWSQAAWPPDPPCETWPPVPISGIRGLLRAEDGIIYQATTNGEFVLYDFTMEVGDTVEGFNTTFRVDSIDQIMVNDNLCKRFWVVEGIWQGFSDQPIWIVENVGHQHGLFESMYQFENSSNLCYRENGVPLVHSQWSQGCSIISTEYLPSDAVSISPNPSTGIFAIDFQQPFSYQVFDLFGKLVDEGSGNGRLEMDITTQPNGIYLLRVDSEQGFVNQKLVKN